MSLAVYCTHGQPLAPDTAISPDGLPTCGQFAEGSCQGDGTTLKERLEALPSIGEVEVAAIDNDTGATGYDAEICAVDGVSNIKSVPSFPAAVVSIGGSSNYIEHRTLSEKGASLPISPLFCMLPTRNTRPNSSSRPLLLLNQVSITFLDASTNGGDLPLISAVSSDTEIMQVEVAESVKGSAPFVNEVQRITIVSSSSTDLLTGTFAVVGGRDRTNPIAFDASDSDLAAALEQLPGTRSSVSVSSSDNSDLPSWTVTFTSPGPRGLLASPCQEPVEGDETSADCLLENASVQIQRVIQGRLPASGTFRLGLVPASGRAGTTKAADVSTTAPLPLDASADEVRAAVVGLVGGRDATVTVAPNARAEYGFDWGLALHDNGASSVELVEVNFDDPGPWCTDGVTGPAPADTACEFPFTVGGHETHFTCASTVGSGLGWCSTTSTFNESQSWGGCVRCAEGGPVGSPTLHVASLRRSFRLRGGVSQVSQALSEAVYHPRAFWNAWLGGHDEVSAYRYDEKNLAGNDHLSGARARSVAQVFVAPINDPPTVTVGEETRVVYESEELLLEDAEIFDPDLADRSTVVPVQVELEAGYGTVTFGDPSGLTFVSGLPEPHSSQRLVVTGPLATVQNAVRQVYYRPLLASAAGTGTAPVRTTLEVQRLEVIAPVLPMVQSVTTSATKGYIEGNFVLSVDCSAFYEEVDDFFAADVDMFNEASIASFASVIESPQFLADAPATGDGSVETGVRELLTRCVDLAWDRAILLTSLSSSTEPFTEDMVPHRGATAVVSRGEPDLHGSIRWMISVVDVPQSFPVFEVSSHDLTGEGEGLDDSPYAFDDGSSLSATASISVDIVQAPSLLSGPSGTFTLVASPGGAETDPIPTSASADEMTAALTSLADVGAVQVSSGPIVASPPATPALGRYWEITFLQSGSPVQAGDLPPIKANWAEIAGEEVELIVSEVVKGQSLSDTVTILVNDLGNVGEGGAFEAAAAWNVAIIPEDVAPAVQQVEDAAVSSRDLLRTFEGAVEQLPTVLVSHVTTFKESADLLYLARLACSRGAVKPSPSTVGKGVSVTHPSPTDTLVTGTLSDINRALSNMQYYAPLRYRGVDDVQIAARVAGLGFSGGWGTTKLYVFVDGVNDPPEISAPRLVASKGAVPTTVGGISVADDDTLGIITIKIEAARGLVSFPVPHQLQLLDGYKVRQYLGGARAEVCAVHPKGSNRLNTRTFFILHRLGSFPMSNCSHSPRREHHHATTRCHRFWATYDLSVLINFSGCPHLLPPSAPPRIFSGRKRRKQQHFRVWTASTRCGCTGRPRLRQPEQ